VFDTRGSKKGKKEDKKKGGSGSYSLSRVSDVNSGSQGIQNQCSLAKMFWRPNIAILRIPQLKGGVWGAGRVSALHLEASFSQEFRIELGMEIRFFLS
jgi:hypothetical protein